VLLVCTVGVNRIAFAQTPIIYQLSFPEREHRVMDVDVTFNDLPAGPLLLRMSRSSPGRYALHDFAKNVFNLQVTDASGTSLPVRRTNPHAWDVTGHGPLVRVRYQVYGDWIDGTYLSIDSTHAHINMPAALMWARGLELRSTTVKFDLPAGSGWRVATQLFPGPDPSTFTAPTLQYLMDSPTEVSAFALRSFVVPDGDRTPTFRIAAHHTGTDADLDALARDAERIVREARAVYREFPAYENNTYTFIGDWVPWANGDAMEHRDSTVITGARSIRADRSDILDSMAHEFFHSWNVERIRPRSLEPFDFEDQNLSGELWLAEGFTNYYGPLVLARAGLTTPAAFAAELGPAIDTVITSPARRVRTAEEMSQMAPFVDAATSVDRTSFDNTFISYYTWGSAIGLGLDLTLREQTNQRVTLDDLMRALWQKFGKPGGRAIGYVDNPYTIDDVRRTLGAVAGDQGFADDFFRRYIQGHDVVDYESLLAHAGFVWRRLAAGRATLGLLRIQDDGAGARIAAAVPFDSPAFRAGLDRDDVIVAVGETAVRGAADLIRAVDARKPGDRAAVRFDRHGQRATVIVTFDEDPRHELVPLEQTGKPLTDAERQFRQAWLSSQARNSF
jgi:predicted metalloprotease with PDZ domain